MDAKFFDSLFEGDSANGVKLGMGLTGGDFWPRPNGCHCVYRGQQGHIDYDSIQAVMSLTDSQISIINQALPANTIWHYIRRQVSGCGLESDDSPACVVIIDSDGNMAGNTPPFDLTITKLSNGRFKLQWRYIRSRTEIEPTGFKIYVDSGSGFDFNSPADTVSYTSGVGGEFEWISDPLINDKLYRFCVRSYRTGAGESQNTNFVAAIADAVGPDAITNLIAAWEET